MEFKVKFWGVRGSIACPSPNHVIYGGNTSCVEVSLDGLCVILDAGTGIRLLGHELLARKVNRAILLLTHTHWDHINGFPFFAPVFTPGFTLRVRTGHLMDQGGIRSILASQMSDPTFPVPLEALQANLLFEDFRAGESFLLENGALVRTAPLRHPNDATGYRIEYGGRALCYITDTEHIPGEPDRNILELIKDADLVIYDATYTDAEFPAKVGWGHSTWQEAIRLCRAAAVKRLALFHHDPDHHDEVMQRIENEARQLWHDAEVAREGMEMAL